jgi:hypothetical protein
MGAAKRKSKLVSHEERNQMTTGAAVARQKTARERVLVEFPPALLRQTEEAASQLLIDRSKFIRAAVEEKVAKMLRDRFEQELAAAYAANAEFDLQLCEEFKHVDGEQVR